jgi:hypothetical protein
MPESKIEGAQIPQGLTIIKTGEDLKVVTVFGRAINWVKNLVGKGGEVLTGAKASAALTSFVSQKSPLILEGKRDDAATKTIESLLKGLKGKKFTDHPTIQSHVSRLGDLHAIITNKPGGERDTKIIAEYRKNLTDKLMSIRPSQLESLVLNEENFITSLFPGKGSFKNTLLKDLHEYSTDFPKFYNAHITEKLGPNPTYSQIEREKAFIRQNFSPEIQKELMQTISKRYESKEN